MPEIGKVKNLRDLIALEFESRPGDIEINESINWIIQKMNAKTGGQRVIITATGVSEEDWEDLSTDNWEDWDSADWESLGRWRADFSWDADEYSIKLPGNIVQVEKLYIDDKLWNKVSYEKMKESPNVSEHYYAFLDNKLFFATDINASTDSVKLQVRIEWTDVDASDYVFVPWYWKQLLIDGTVMKLATRDRNVISEKSEKLAIKGYEEGMVTLAQREALKNATSNKLDGIEDIDLNTDLTSQSGIKVVDTDYGLIT